MEYYNICFTAFNLEEREKFILILLDYTDDVQTYEQFEPRVQVVGYFKGLNRSNIEVLRDRMVCESKAYLNAACHRAARGY